MPTYSEDDYTARMRDSVSRLAGQHFQELWSSRESVFRLIHDPSPSVRSAAIISGRDKWKLGHDTTFRQLCCQIASNDERGPRFVAITTLGEIYYGTHDPVVTQLLASVVRDSSNLNEIRNHAYRALREIQFGFEYDTVLDRANENALVLKGQAIPLLDIDWIFVDTIDNGGND